MRKDVGGAPQRLVLVVGVLAMVLTACPEDDPEPEPPPQPVEGGTVVWGYEQEPAVLNPTIRDGALYATEQIALATLLPLWVITPDFRYEPTALLDGASAEQGPPFQVTYDLDDEATWSDGTPVTAGDVFFTLQVCVDEDADITSRAGCDKVDMAATEEGLDPAAKDITVVFTEPYAPWRTLFSTANGVILPRHALEGRRGEAWNTTWTEAIDDPESGEPIASGPFIFDSWDRGRQLELVRNDRYAGERPNLERIVLRFIPDVNTMVQQLRGGEIDLMDPQPQPELMEHLEQIQDIEVQTGVGPIWEHLDFQHTNPALGLRYVRQAIANAIDREEFVRAFVAPIHPEAAPLNSIVYVTTHPDYEDHFGDVVRYDPAASVALLEDNGCERGEDAVFVCEGQRLSFRWVSTTDNDRRAMFFEFAQQALAEIGVEVVPDFGEPAVVFSADGIPAGDYDLANFAWRGTPDPADNVETYKCDGALNYHGHCPSEEVDRLLEESDRELDDAERTRMMNRAGELLADELPILPLYQLPYVVAWRDEFTGLRVNTTQWGLVWNVSAWSRTG